MAKKEYQRIEWIPPAGAEEPGTRDTVLAFSYIPSMNVSEYIIRRYYPPTQADRWSEKKGEYSTSMRRRPSVYLQEIRDLDGIKILQKHLLPIEAAYISWRDSQNQVTSFEEAFPDHPELLFLQDQNPAKPWHEKRAEEAHKKSEDEAAGDLNQAYWVGRHSTELHGVHDTRPDMEAHINDFRFAREQYSKSVDRSIHPYPWAPEASSNMYWRGRIDAELEALKELGLSNDDIMKLNPTVGKRHFSLPHTMWHQPGTKLLATSLVNVANGVLEVDLYKTAKGKYFRQQGLRAGTRSRWTWNYVAKSTAKLDFRDADQRHVSYQEAF